MSARYYPGAEGRRYFYASTALYRCPLAGSDEQGRDKPVFRDAVVRLTALGFDGAKLLRNAHRGGTRAEGGICGHCGVALEKLGYRAWREVPSEQASEQYRSSIASRLGFDYVTEDSRLFGLKREAIAWAREQASLDRQITAEEKGKR